jgi:hypothetical protein
MKSLNKQLLENKMDNLKIDLNNLFCNSEFDIEKMLKNNNIITRHRKLTFKDCLCYKFNCSFKYNTQESVVNDYKFDNSLICEKSSFFRKENKIPIDFYKNIYEQTLKLHNKYCTNKPFKIIAVDGTYNNTNINNNKTLETSLNMGYYDISNSIPFELTFKGPEFKNKEIESLIDKINENCIDFTSVIFVLDRAYCSYKLMDFLESKCIKFVVRIKNNFKCIKNDNISEHNNNFRLVNYNYNTETIKELKNKNTGNYEIYNVITNVNCNVITNLDPNLFDTVKIREIYNSRWKVEEFFKLIKSNFNFSNLKNHHIDSKICHQKSYYVIQIVCLINQIIENIITDHLNKHNNEKYNVKINKSSLISGMKRIIEDIIHSRLSTDKLILLIESYVNFNYCDKYAHNPRISKTPFTKWYIKDYHSKYDLQKMLDAYLEEDKSELNKNLKSKLKNYTFILIK